nr:MAG TPA: hypothetical protein [Caudoviricetes sp.]
MLSWCKDNQLNKNIQIYTNKNAFFHYFFVTFEKTCYLCSTK